MVTQMCGKDVSAFTDRGLDLAEQGGFLLWIAFGRAQIAHKQFNLEKTSGSARELEKCVNAILELGVHVNTPYFMSLLASAYHQVGDTNRGLIVLEEALSSITDRNESWWEAEIHRLRGEFLLSQSSGNTHVAKECFDTAIDIAREQLAKSLELRAVMSAARLSLLDDGCTDGRQALLDCFSWFKEGFNTSDLIEAKQLINSLQ